MEQLDRTANVPRQLGGQRVDRVAATLFGEFSRAMLSRWIQAGALSVNGRPVRPKDRLVGGERLELHATLVPREDWQTAQRVAFELIYEDDALLVINKPAGLVVHPGAGNPDRTLVNGLLEYRPALRQLPRAGIVHRLDKDTSGLLLVAGDLPTHHRLVKMLAAREIERRYLAVVEGSLTGGTDIDAPIGRDPVQRTRQRVREDGRPALTRVRVIARYRCHTAIDAKLETGRTHQIRVHLASIGHPLVGDVRYGARGRLPPAAAPATIAALRGFARQALHAAQLELAHPQSGEPLAFAAPPPEDLQCLMDVLAEDVDTARSPGGTGPG